jgi:hypothetical protein
VTIQPLRPVSPHEKDRDIVKRIVLAVAGGTHAYAYPAISKKLSVLSMARMRDILNYRQPTYLSPATCLATAAPRGGSLRMRPTVMQAAVRMALRRQSATSSAVCDVKTASSS